MSLDVTTPEPELRDRALANIRRKREFWSHLLAYVLINSLLVLTWAVTGAGFFWPMFPLAGWGVGLVFHGLDTYSREPSEARVRAEMDRLADR